MAIIPAQEKVFMVSNGTNTTYGGSAALQAMNQWYTMEDISDSVVVTAPYKVFTALLTQSGVDFYINNSTDGIEPFIVGVTYYIDENNSPTANFTNIGAPNNNVGTYFIATGTTPQSWGNGEYVNLRYNTGAPVATVLENTIGNIWFSYVDPGVYIINSDGLFIENKTILLSSYFTGTNSDVTYNTIFNQVDNSTIGIGIGDGNGYLNGSPIEIRVYN
jgi:hypothetical protein